MTRKALTYRTSALRAAAIFGFAATIPGCAAPPADTRLDALRAAEDARGTTSDALAPLFSYLHPDSEPALLRVAVRSIGRLQRPALLDSLAPFLSHADEGVRIEAANAVAQSVQGGVDTTALDQARGLLLRRLTEATSDAELGVVARSLGRLPHQAPAFAEQIGERIAAAAATGRPALACPPDVRQETAPDSVAPARLFGTMHGIYAVARRTRRLGCDAENLARSATTYRAAISSDTTAWIRELSVLALQAANRADTSVLLRSIADSDPRVRRLGLRVTRETPPAVLLRLATTGLSDSAAMVRIDAARALTLTRSPEACALARRALEDARPLVRAEGVDATAAACEAGDATILLDSLVRLLPADTVSGGVSWHVPARALVALARTAPNVATPHFAHFRVHPVWQARAALGAAARVTGDTGVLIDLLGDRDANVREETILAMAAINPSLRERAVRAGLADSGYQVVLAAAQAAEPLANVDVALLAGALQRLTARRQETSRDPRRELVERIAQRGTVRDTAMLRPYASDFDTVVARRAAETLTRWTGAAVSATPQPLPMLTDTPGAARQLRITLSPASGGGSFLVRLYPDEAPATVGRVVRLARDGYYAGHTIHRVVPNFVIQGGGPDANEYVGDGPFMRDELGLRSHTRGTLGISTRGRDTGDAQLFVNLIDNFRLDHDYTVFGDIVQGMDVVDRIQAGTVIQRVDVIEGSR